MKILVADDEDYTREGLIESICWESYGIDEIMQAVNGAEALKIAKWFHPDIVLTDIRMPKMDGIAFATQLMKENPDSRIIFMSGYMEIEYLKSAIRLSAVDYIEKPIDLSVVETALRKAADEIREKKRSKEATQASREVQQQKLFRLLTSKEPDKKTVEKLAGELDFPLQHCLYVCLNLLLRGKDGTAVRFEPGETRRVSLVEIGGTREGYGLNGLVEGKMDDPSVKEKALKTAKERGFKGVDQDE